MWLALPRGVADRRSATKRQPIIDANMKTRQFLDRRALPARWKFSVLNDVPPSEAE